MRTDGRTKGHDPKLIVAFRNFANAPNNWNALSSLHKINYYCLKFQTLQIITNYNANTKSRVQ